MIPFGPLGAAVPVTWGGERELGQDKSNLHLIRSQEKRKWDYWIWNLTLPHLLSASLWKLWATPMRQDSPGTAAFTLFTCLLLEPSVTPWPSVTGRVVNIWVSLNFRLKLLRVDLKMFHSSSFPCSVIFLFTPVDAGHARFKYWPPEIRLNLHFFTMVCEAFLGLTLPTSPSLMLPPILYNAPAGKHWVQIEDQLLYCIVQMYLIILNPFHLPLAYPIDSIFKLISGLHCVFLCAQLYY